MRSTSTGASTKIIACSLPFFDFLGDLYEYVVVGTDQYQHRTFFDEMNDTTIFSAISFWYF